MWYLFLFLFPLINGFSDEKHCNFARCRTLSSPGFPANREELDNFCSMSLEKFRCTTEVAEGCFKADSNEVTRFRSILQTTSTLCNSETALYAAIAENVGCYKQVVEKDGLTCSKIGEEIRKLFEESDVHDSQHIMCLKELGIVACNLEKIGETCGDSAESTVLEFFHAIKIDSVLEMSDCFHAELEQIKSMVELTKVEERNKQRMMSVFEMFN